MNTQRFCSLICVVGCLSSAALGAADSPTREVLNSYPYQPELVARPATPPVAARAINPEVAPGFAASVLNYQDYDALDVAIAAEARRRSDALYVWSLPGDLEAKAIGRPTVQELDIPWSPMTAANDVTFSPGSIGNSSDKLQALVPLFSLNW
jgi:hypothetical protein